MPMFDSLFQSWRSHLSPQQAIKLAQFYLASAETADEPVIAMALCEQAETNLDRIKRPKSLGALEDEEYKIFREDVAAAYSKHAKFMADWKYAEKALASRTKSEKWGGVAFKEEAPLASKLAVREHAPLLEGIFEDNVARPTTVLGGLPEVNQPLINTTQLAYCLAAVDAIATTAEADLPDATRVWALAVKKDHDEEKRLREL
ncbi:hypothetical protein BGZ70_008309, partial [Mortierella alpina]